jgi:hypothetical protein
MAGREGVLGSYISTSVLICSDFGGSVIPFLIVHATNVKFKKSAINATIFFLLSFFYLLLVFSSVIKAVSTVIQTDLSCASLFYEAS